jgi:DNA polymerase III subunit epsilon
VGRGAAGAVVVRVRPQPLGSRLTAAEHAAHVTFIATLGDGAIWRDYLREADFARSA